MISRLQEQTSESQGSAEDFDKFILRSDLNRTIGKSRVDPDAELSLKIMRAFARKIVALAEATGTSDGDREQFKAAVDALCVAAGNQNKRVWKKHYLRTDEE